MSDIVEKLHFNTQFWEIQLFSNSELSHSLLRCIKYQVSSFSYVITGVCIWRADPISYILKVTHPMCNV